MRLRVPVDFTTFADHEKGYIRINIVVHPDLLEVLRPGMLLTLFDADGMEVDAIAEFDEQFGFWYGIPDWSTRRDLDV